MKRLLVVGLLVAVAGCETTGPQPLAAVPIQSDTATFTNTLLSKKVADGYTIVSQTPNMLVLEKTELHDVGKIMLYGTGYGPPRYRLTYQMFGTDPLNVQISGVMVENAGTAFERSYPLNNDKVGKEAQVELRSIAAILKPS